MLLKLVGVEILVVESMVVVVSFLTEDLDVGAGFGVVVSLASCTSTSVYTRISNGLVLLTDIIFN